MKMTRKQAEWLIENEEVGYEVFSAGYRKGAAMKWPEMVFWICLIMWLGSLAVGGV